MIEAALNVAAEQLVEFSAYGNLMGRLGNRSALAAPQGLYPCAGGAPGAERWLALSVASDAQWRALRSVLGEPDWARDPALDSRAGRHAAHDAIDAELRAWTRLYERSGLAARLRAAGIPASEVADPNRLLQTNAQLAFRGYFETTDHPEVGRMPLASLPFHYASIERWLRTPAPTLGEHNERVLGRILGLSPEDLRALADEGVIGTRPDGL
jgi:crotonobetainyl-CoA:carnitine CoA-transferase CaiB-like acyl-CoA transferase